MSLRRRSVQATLIACGLTLFAAMLLSEAVSALPTEPDARGLEYSGISSEELYDLLREVPPEKLVQELESRGAEVNQIGKIGSPAFGATKSNYNTCGSATVPYLGWTIVWIGGAGYDANVFASVVWADPNYNLDMYVVEFPLGAPAEVCFSAYWLTNMESINEDVCLGNCHYPNPWMSGHSPNPCGWKANSIGYLLVRMRWAFQVSGPESFCWCIHFEQ
jgi:hypothetical protein